jgi:hypothetical protein
MVAFEGFNASINSLKAPNDETKSNRLGDQAIALLAPSTARAAELVAQPSTDEANARVWLVADQPVPVLHGGDRRPHQYKGGIGPDAPQVGAIMRRLGPEAALAWDSFIKNYNDRSSESVIPKDLPLNEIDTPFKGKLDWYGPYADSDLSFVGTQGGRDLKPYADTSAGSSKAPGHIYAVGTTQDNTGKLAPVEILDYESRQGQAVRYYGQYQFKYTNTDDGGLQVDISQWNPAKGNLYEPVTTDIAGQKHALNGLTEYKFDKNGNLISAAQFIATAANQPTAMNGNNPTPVNTNKPILSLQFGDGGQAFDGKTHLPLSDWNLSLAAPKLMYFDLFGPKRD